MGQFGNNFNNSSTAPFQKKTLELLKVCEAKSPIEGVTSKRQAHVLKTKKLPNRGLGNTMLVPAKGS
jgi:ribosomal protein L34E